MACGDLMLAEALTNDSSGSITVTPGKNRSHGDHPLAHHTPAEGGHHGIHHENQYHAVFHLAAAALVHKFGKAGDLTQKGQRRVKQRGHRQRGQGRQIPCLKRKGPDNQRPQQNAVKQLAEHFIVDLGENPQNSGNGSAGQEEQQHNAGTGQKFRQHKYLLLNRILEFC